MNGIAWLEQEDQRLQLYLDKRAELREKKRGLGRLGYLTYLPYPKQFITLLLGLLVLGGVVAAYPLMFKILVDPYMPARQADGRTLFLVVTLYSMAVTGMLFMVMAFGGPVRAFMKSKFTGKDIVETYNTSNRKEYLVPQEITGGVYDLDKDRAVMPTDDSFYNGPGGRRMTCAIPESPITFNPRNVVNKGTTGLDMMSLRVYGIKNQQRQWEKDKSGREWIQPFLMPLIILLVIGLILGPFFYEKMKEFDSAKECRESFDAYKTESMRAGYVPPELQEALDKPDPTKVAPAQTGGGIRKSGS